MTNKWIVFDVDDVICNFKESLYTSLVEIGKDIHWSKWNQYSHTIIYDMTESQLHLHMKNYNVIENSLLEPGVLELFNKLKKEDIKKLRLIQKCGHEIAFHTTNHFNMVKYLNNKGMDSLIQNEILAGLSKMNADRFYPTTFAYPFGRHTQAMDNTLLKYFKSVRALNGTNNYAKSLATTNNNSILYGLGIDESSKRPLSTILQLVDNAHDDNNCLVLVSHHTDLPGTKFITSHYTLREIIKKAVALNMHFYTVSEISR